MIEVNCKFGFTASNQAVKQTIKQTWRDRRGRGGGIKRLKIIYNTKRVFVLYMSVTKFLFSYFRTLNQKSAGVQLYKN